MKTLRLVLVILWRLAVALTLILLVAYGGHTNIRIDGILDATYDNYRRSTTNAWHIKRIDWRIGVLHNLPESFNPHPEPLNQ